MKEALRVAVAEDEPELLEDLREMLLELGHQVVATATNGQELIEQCEATHPDLVIADIRMPIMDGLEAADRIRQAEPVPVVLVSAHSEPELIDRALQNHVLSYLIKPIKADQLKTAIALAMGRFREFKTLRREASDLRQALQDRKVIERAKGVLMKEADLDEAEAFRRLQQLASSKNQKMLQIAEAILLGQEAIAQHKKE
jgi:AmiR/NasT family two-component response regulator